LVILFNNQHTASSDDIELLMTMTFPGRKQELQSGDEEYDTLKEFLSERCPFLMQPIYVFIHFSSSAIKIFKF